jgi:uncharacterized protein YbjQ (UPF0145 family)
MQLSSPITIAALNHKNTRVISSNTSLSPSKQSRAVPQRQYVPSFPLLAWRAYFNTLDPQRFTAISKAAQSAIRLAISGRIFMIITTTDQFEGRRVIEYLGVVTGEAIIGVNVFRDFFAGIRDIVGGRSGGYQNALRDAREHAMADMRDAAKRLGADAVVGIDLDYEVLGKENGMLMVSINGTAVRLG